jgi:hypothetical protein
VDLQQQLTEIREHYRGRLEEFRSQIMGDAVSFLRADIENPELTGPNVHPDLFMFRANQIGLALLQTGYYALAEQFYRNLLQETLQYRQRTGNWRHAGALYANIAGACAAQRKIDLVVVELLKAAQDDEQTYRVRPADSFAIKELLQQYFGSPVREAALTVVQQVDSALTIQDVEAMCQFLGDREYAFLAYFYVAWTNEEINRQFQNEFSQLQIFGALRSLSALWEVQLKTITGNPSMTLYPTLESLYRLESWWTDFENARGAVGATRNSTSPIDNQLRDAIAIVPANNAANFWKSLLIAYITRNYTTHQLETQCSLIQTYSQQVLGRLLHTMIGAYQRTLLHNP